MVKTFYANDSLTNERNTEDGGRFCNIISLHVSLINNFIIGLEHICICLVMAKVLVFGSFSQRLTLIAQSCPICSRN